MERTIVAAAPPQKGPFEPLLSPIADVRPGETVNTTGTAL
jgi:hypothetical protein